MIAVEWSNVHLAGAFLLGAILATVAVLRIVKSVTNFFAGFHEGRRLDRQSNPRNDPPDEAT